MSELLKVLAELMKMLFSVSPATAVLFVLVCALFYHVHQKNKEVKELNAAAIAREERVQTQITAATSEREKLFNEKLDEKECEIKIQQERGIQRDKEVSQFIQRMIEVIRASNQGAQLQSCWNGIHAIIRSQEIDPQQAGMFQHMNQNQGQLPVNPPDYS